MSAILISCAQDLHVNESGPIHSTPLAKFNRLPHRGHFNSLLVVEDRKLRVMEVKRGEGSFTIKSSTPERGGVSSLQSSFIYLSNSLHREQIIVL